MKANGGVFVVDDFGRQRIPPRDLLNRWIVPLESRVDFLTLHTGRKFEIPFNVLIIFATNLKPESLADEAFLRRIPYKIRAKNPTVDEYLPHLRDELPQAEHRVRSGHGRVPAAEVLPAAQAADARVPSARSGRAGRRTLPLSEPRAGRSRASCSTRRAAAISSKRPSRKGQKYEGSLASAARRPGRRAADRPPRCSPRPVGGRAGSSVASSSAEISSRMAIVAAFTVLAVRLGARLHGDRPLYRPAAARERSARGGADRVPPADRHRRSQLRGTRCSPRSR